MQPFKYIRPANLSDAVGALAAAGPGTKVLAGGTNLFDLMKLNVERPATIVDINGISELASFDTSGRTELIFGSLARMSDVAEDRQLRAQYPALAESLWKAASQQLRNMASVGGNLLQRTRCNYFRNGAPFACNKRDPGSGCSAINGHDRTLGILGVSADCIANYPGDWAVALVAFDAVVDVYGPSGQRSIPLEQLYREPGETPHIETVLAPNELIARIRVPVSRVGRASTYHKIRDRESYAFALTSAAVALEMSGSTVRGARIALGGVASRPWRAREAEESLLGKKLTRAIARRAGALAFQGARSGGQSGFRIELGGRTVEDALMIAMERA